MSKYRNQRTTVNGIIFDSRREAKRYCELAVLERAGVIQDLQMQKTFVLVPEQREEPTERYKKGIHKGEWKPGTLIERPITYIADFVYHEKGQLVVEDAKGLRTKEYIIKRKLMLYIHNIRIKEV